jgi:MFS family permease
MTAHRHQIAAVMGCHFVAAFAALGMPPFFALILDQSLHNDLEFLAGWLYVVPILFTAISSPWWGRKADRYGKKPLLLRAQLGRAASFLLAGFASDVRVFVAALVLQGLLGGTFAASNAYLATLASGQALARSLNWMQWSARAALVVAPIGLGAMMVEVESPIVLYRYLALLPLLAAVMLWWLPAGAAQPAKPVAEKPHADRAEATPWQVYWLQFALVFSTVVTFPYFVSLAQAPGMAASPAVAGMLFGLPHLVYLGLAMPVSRRLEARSRMAAFKLACLLLVASLLGQVWAPTLLSLAVWRLVMGVGMTMAMVSLNGLIAGVVRHEGAGRTFGWLESSSKWGAVLAGFAAGLAVHFFDPTFPFFIGAASLLIACGYLAAAAAARPRLGNS